MNKESELKLDAKSMRGLLKRRVLINTLNLLLFGTLFTVGMVIDKMELWYLVMVGVLGLFYVGLNYLFYIMLYVSGTKYALIVLSANDITGTTTYLKPFRIHRDMIVKATVKEENNFIKIKVRGVRKPIEFKYYFEKSSYDRLIKALNKWQVDINKEG